MNTCPLCWYEFDAEEDLAIHIEMEDSVDYQIELEAAQ